MGVTMTMSGQAGFFSTDVLYALQTNCTNRHRLLAVKTTTTKLHDRVFSIIMDTSNSGFRTELQALPLSSKTFHLTIFIPREVRI